MTDLALRGSTNLMTFAEEAHATHAIAKALSTTSFVPSSMKSKPDEITGAILFGRELGMDPMTALQTINVIQGRPTLTANAMRGLAMGAGVKFRLDEANETRCTMSAIAPGQEQWTTITWNLDQARKLGLTSKENWKNQPGAMLIARATSQLCRLVAANVLIGLPYSSEEMNDVAAAEAPSANVNPDPEKKTRRISRATVAVGEEPSFEEVQLPAADQPKAIEAEPADSISDKTRKALMAGFNDIDIKDRVPRLAYVSDILGREVHTVNQISEAEARKVLDALSADRVSSAWPAAAPVPNE